MKKIFTELSVLACFCFLLLSDVAYAQNVTVKGTIVDDQKLPIPGVSVVIKGTTNGVQTDASGTYTISAPSNGTFVVSSIGFNTQEIPINNRTTININLISSTNDLQQVVVVGYGTQRKRDLTGSITSIKGEEIEKMTVTNPISALQGKVPGLTLVNSGTPGAAPTVRIRGVASPNGANPLYVVDGIFQDNIDYLNPNDIETIDLLKDASSTAIFGLRGANGVIAITTKRAAKGKTTVTLQSTVGIQHVDKLIDVADATGFTNLYTAALAGTPNSTAFDFRNYNGNTNWQKEILRDAYINTNSLTVSNSSEKSSTVINVGYNDQDGVVKYGNFKKYTARLYQENNITKKIKIGGDITGYHFRNQPTTVNLNSAVWAAPIVPIRNNEGLFNAMPSFQRAQVGNPVYAMERMRDKTVDRGYRATGSLFAEVKFLKDFTWRSSVYADLRFNSVRGYNPLPFPIVYIGEDNNPTTVFQDPAARTAVNQSSFERRMFQQDHTLTFDKTIANDHKITALAGFTTMNLSNTSLSGNRTDSTLVVPNSPDFWYLNTIGLNNILSNGGGGELESQVGAFARASYSYKDKYLLNATIRRDGSSKVAPQNRWGTFGSVGLGWVVSQENFFSNIKSIDFLKLRAAWGRLGNISTFPNNAFQAGLSTGDGAVFGDYVYPSIKPAYRPDPNLRWEVIQGLDFGLDLRALNNRLSLEVNYYDKDTRNLFVPVRLEGDNIDLLTNLGNVSNKGTEVSVGWSDKIGEDFSYNIGGNFSYVKNRVESIGEGINYQRLGNGGVNVTEAGKPIASFFGYRQVGIYQTTADLDRMPALPNSLPGDIAFADTNGDGVISPADRTYLGTPFPPYTYGMNISVSYKGFDASIDGQGVAGNKIWLQRRTANFAPLNYEANRLNAWSGAGTTNIEPTIVSRGNNLLFSTYFLEDGDYFRLRNVQIGYTIPKTILTKVGIQRLRFYVSGQNIKTWSKVSGYTPEVPVGNVLEAGADNGVYPIPAIYSFGLNLTF
ncbi:MAG: TonB-dependent receptor [Chitinophagaceae bacterium]|nr:MAG: TonB-dependent receptor [Chitinophagaceae bacterium]